MSQAYSRALCFFCEPYEKVTHEKVESGIIANEFGPNSVNGFQIHFRREKLVCAVYIEKHEYVEEITDPFGGKIEFQRIEYQHIHFLVKEDPPNIIIFNPPRFYTKLLNKIAQLTDYNIVIEDKAIDLLSWVSEIFENGLSGNIIKMLVDKIKYDSKTFGSLVLTSSDDLRTKFAKILASKSYTLKKVTIDYGKDFDRPKTELNSNGRVVFGRQVDVVEFEEIYKAFCKAASLK